MQGDNLLQGGSLCFETECPGRTVHFEVKRLGGGLLRSNLSPRHFTSWHAPHIHPTPSKLLCSQTTFWSRCCWILIDSDAAITLVNEALLPAYFFVFAVITVCVHDQLATNLRFDICAGWPPDLLLRPCCTHFCNKTFDTPHLHCVSLYTSCHMHWQFFEFSTILAEKYKQITHLLRGMFK